MEAFRQGDGLGSQLSMRLAPFTLPLLLADALAGVGQLVSINARIRMGVAFIGIYFAVALLAEAGLISPIRSRWAATPS